MRKQRHTHCISLIIRVNLIGQQKRLCFHADQKTNGTDPYLKYGRHRTLGF